MNENHKDKVARLKAVMDWTGLSRSTLYAMMKDGLFPQSFALGARSVGWLESDIQNWIASRKNGGVK